MRSHAQISPAPLPTAGASVASAALSCQARIYRSGPACAAPAEWLLRLACGLTEIAVCGQHRDSTARMFAALTPTPDRWFEQILRDARRLQ